MANDAQLLLCVPLPLLSHSASRWPAGKLTFAAVASPQHALHVSHVAGGLVPAMAIIYIVAATCAALCQRRPGHVALPTVVRVLVRCTAPSNGIWLAPLLAIKAMSSIHHQSQCGPAQQHMSHEWTISN